MHDDHLRYPIGRLELPTTITEEHIAQWIQDIEILPRQFSDAVSALPPGSLDTPYRPGGWTLRQVIHHVADSHINSYIRFKWTLTETMPTIKPYDEKAWAELPDMRDTPVGVSLRLLGALHERWVILLRALTPEQLQLTFIHPESGPVRLEQAIGLYSWHGRHHLSHLYLIN